MKEIYLKNKRTFDSILLNKKKVEGRINKGFFKSIEVGNEILFRHENSQIEVTIIKISHYKSFELLLIDMDNVLPYFETVSEGVKYYYSLYNKNLEDIYGVIGIEFIKKIKIISNNKWI
jgi:ASC-1-like (ASCH) protein